jgi:hypothetical protein
MQRTTKTNSTRLIPSVGGKNFPAHKIVLATQSPVFKAELYGSMKERSTQHVTVEDILPDVFKALLHFIYTVSLPDSDWEDLVLMSTVRSSGICFLLQIDMPWTG